MQHHKTERCWTGHRIWWEMLENFITTQKDKYFLDLSEWSKSMYQLRMVQQHSTESPWTRYYVCGFVYVFVCVYLSVYIFYTHIGPPSVAWPIHCMVDALTAHFACANGWSVCGEGDYEQNIDNSFFLFFHLPPHSLCGDFIFFGHCCERLSVFFARVPFSKTMGCAWAYREKSTEWKMFSVCNPTHEKFRTHNFLSFVHFIHYICKTGYVLSIPDAPKENREKHRKSGIIIMAEILMAPT